MSTPRLTLLVPQLLWPEPEDAYAFNALALPGLETLLAHARLQCLPRISWEESLAHCFALDGDAPFAALRQQGEVETIESADAHWLCADPVHLKFHHERIVLADSSAFELSIEESGALVAALNSEFSDLGSFHMAHPQRWYLRLSAANAHWPVPNLKPISAVAGRSIDDQMPEGGDASHFKRWLNEVQMFLHAHPVNQAREAKGLSPVNSLWLWGGGCASKHEAEFSGVWSNQPLAIGLARSARVPQHPEAADLATVLAHAATDSHHLVILDALLTPTLYEDSSTWREALLLLEERWFAPLAKAALPLTLIAPTRYGCLQWDSQPIDRWKFWRRPQSLATLARSLA